MSRSGRRPPWRIRLRASCIENRFSPVASGGAYCGRRAPRAPDSRADRAAPRTSAARRPAIALPNAIAVGEVELAVDVDRQPLARADDLQHRLDALEVLGERHAADLHLHAGVAEVEIVLHLVLQRRRGPCRDSSSRRRHRPTPCRRTCRRCSGRPAASTAARAWPWPRHPTAPCRARRPRPSARRGRPASRWPSSPPSTWPDRSGPRRRAARRAWPPAGAG